MRVEEKLTTSQAARALGVSGVYVRQMCDRGVLGHEITPLGRLIPRENVERLKHERESKGKSA